MPRCWRPDVARGPDTRFAVIEDAVALLQMLPAPADIAWPTDAGDLEALDDALAWIRDWLPKARAAHKEHCRIVKAQAALRAAMNTARP